MAGAMTMRVAAGLVAVILASSCSQASPSTAPTSVPAATPAGAPTRGSGLTPVPVGSMTPAVTTPGPSATTAPTAPASRELIEAAIGAGAIDQPTAALYRLYAAFGDDRLPEAYRGEPAWDEDAVDFARGIYQSLSADMQAEVAPFLVRPTSPRSYWAGPQTTALAAQVGTGQVAAATCQNGWLREQASSPAAAVVWGQCGGMPEANVAAQVSETAFDIEQLWPAMTGMMGQPLGDHNDPTDGLADTPEGGDGLLDIYLIDPGVSVRVHGRSLGVPNIAYNQQWPPYVGATSAQGSSGYIVIDRTGKTGSLLLSIVAHEFFHQLQNRYNRTGTPLGGFGRFWFVEASAVWSEHEFAAGGRALRDGPYEWYDEFRGSGESLTSMTGRNPYVSWVWPYFMGQEGDRQAISDAWHEMQDKTGYAPLQAAVDSVLPFETGFREFAVRVLDQDLQPGDPLHPRFQELDPDFPLELPKGIRVSAGNSIPAGSYMSFQHLLPSLGSRYIEIVPVGQNTKLTLDFAGLAISPTVDIDVLVKTRSAAWARRQGDVHNEITLCDAERVWVVLANHDQTLNAQVSASWRADVDVSTCAPEAWRVVLEGPKAGAGTYSGADESYCSHTPELGWNGIVFINPAGGGDIRGLSVNEDYFLINTRFAFDDPVDWGTVTIYDMSTTTLQGDATASPARLIGDSSWTIPTADGTIIGPFQAHVEITCTELDMVP